MLSADLRLALRRPLRSWRAATSVVLIGGLGVGLTAVAFTVAYDLLGKEPPFRNSHELVNVWRLHFDGEEVVASAAALREWGSWTDVFADVAGVRSDQLDLSAGGVPSRVTASIVTPNFFDVLAVTPILGRVFSAADETLTDSVVISEATWKSLFGASPSVIGQRIQLRGATTQGLREYVVSAVVASDIVIPRVPLAMVYVAEAREELFGEKGMRPLYVAVGRLLHGRLPHEARPVVSGRVGATASPGRTAVIGAELRSLEQGVRAAVARPVQFVMFAAGCLLVICWANIAGILLVASARRAREFALRLALGSSQKWLLALTTAESLVLAAAVGSLGTVIASWLQHLLVAVSPVDLPQLRSVQLDVIVFLFILGMCVTVAVLFSLVPAWIASRLELNQSLSAVQDRSAGQLAWLEMLSGAQVAVVLSLLVLSTFAVGRLVSLASVNSGFDSRGVVAAYIALDRGHMASPERRSAFGEQLLAEVRSRPEISAAAIASNLPPSVANNVLLVLPGGTRIRPVSRYVSRDYARVLGAPVLEGDATRDSFDAMNVFVNRKFVARYLNGGPAVGTRLFFSSELNPAESWTIGGVIGDMRESSLVEEAEPTVYQSSLHAGRHPTRFWLMGRARQSTAAAATAIQEVVRAADPSLAADFRTLDDHVAQYSARQRFFALILVCFTAVTLLLSGAGIATTLESCVAHRITEIGIRVALGASPMSVAVLVMRRIALLLAAAAVAGLWVGASLLQFTGSLVVPDSGTHMPWVTYAVPVATVMLIGIGAAIVPLRRALSREPLEALRSV